MEYLEGETLALRLNHGLQPLPEVLRLGAQIGDALDRAHRSGITHRDLKPANIFLVRRGGRSGPPDVKLLDSVSPSCVRRRFRRKSSRPRQIP